jgi:outer membrane receptor protein involved in Fe transport
MSSALLFVSLISILVSGLSAGTTGKIAGVVTDATTAEPLIGVNIIVEDTQMGAATSEDGEYFIINIPPGRYTILASYMGYKKTSQTAVYVQIDKTTVVDFELEPTIIETEAITVTAYRPGTVEIDVTATKTNYEIAEVREIAGVTNLSDILELQADVVDNHFRGGREGEAAYYLGGASINNPLSNERVYNPMILALEQVEVLTSGFSAEYGNAQSGVINMVPKEGGSTWETHLEISGSTPYYKQIGGSPYDPDESLLWWNNQINPDLEYSFSDLDFWEREDAARTNYPYWRDMGWKNYPSSTWDPLTRQDSAWFVQLAYQEAQIRMQEIGLEYKNRNVDPRVDFSIGGPIADDLRLLVVARNESSMPQLPTPRPNLERQIMSNLVWLPNTNNKIRLSYNNIYEYEELASLDGWESSIFNLTTEWPKQERQTNQIGLYWNHVFNPSKFLELNAQILNDKEERRADNVHDDAYYLDDVREGHPFDPGKISGGFTEEGMYQSTQRYRKTYTYSLDASMTNQVDKYNLLKTGLQLQYYDLYVNDEHDRSSQQSSTLTQYHKYPFEGGLYIQNKIEFEGLIANFGLRYDFYQFNTKYYIDTFAPFRNPDYDPNAEYYFERGPYYDKENALTDKSKLYTQLQPRIGVSFPISDISVFHLNYGTFTQRVPFEIANYDRLRFTGDIVRLANPRLEPEYTQAYDIGLVQAFPFGFTLDVSAYYKSVRNLIEEATYFDSQQQPYTAYVNRDYANIKGFHVNLEKETGYLQSYLKYTYQSATGKSSTTSEAPVVYFENPPEGQASVELPDPEDIFLNYDRTHRLITNIRLFTPLRYGPKSILGDMILSITYVLQSGRPYTWDDKGLGLRMNKRTPTEHHLKCRIQKSFRLGDQSRLKIYGEGFNLLNDKVYDYDYVFDPDGLSLIRYHEDREKLFYYNDNNEEVWTQYKWVIFGNQPRNFRFGLIMEF